MSKTKKTFIYRAFISMLCVLASCSSDDSGSSDKHSSPSTAVVSLGCTNLQETVVKGGTIAKPKLICNNGRTADDIIWNGLPGDDIWRVDPNTYAPDFVISVSATCGSVELWDVPCGTVVVEAVSSSSRAGGSSSSVNGSSSSSTTGGSSSSVAGGSSNSTTGGSSSSVGGGSSSSGAAVAVLTCTGLQANVAKGGTITQPNLACTNGANPTGIEWTGRPTNGGAGAGWVVSSTTQSTSYTIRVNATCGAAGNQSGVSCGTVIVGTGSSSSTGNTSSSSSVAGTGSSSSVAGTGSSSSVAGTGSSSSVAGTGSSSSVAGTGSSSSVAGTGSSSSVAGTGSSSSVAGTGSSSSTGGDSSSSAGGDSSSSGS